MGLDEDSIIKANYTQGPAVVHSLIPHRTIGWIRQRAHRLGIAKKLGPRRKISIGDTFGHLTVLEKLSVRSASGLYKKIRFVCFCACGNQCTVDHSHLLRGTQSCGCTTASLIANKKRKKAGYSSTTQLMKSYKAGAINRGLVWEIDRNEFEVLIAANCRYCGRPPANARKLVSGDTILWNGLDRVDNRLGYTKTNVTPCCTICNFAKRTLTVDEFRAWAKDLSSNLGTW